MFLIYTVLSLHLFLSIEAVSLNPCAKWSTIGITVFGGNSQGNASNQLNLPQGMFLHRGNSTLYVADTGNRRIQMFSLDQPSMAGITVASNIDSISTIYVADDGITMYIALRYENRVEKWIKGASSGEQVGDQCKQCRSVWVDKEKNIYMTESGTHSVLRWSPETNTSRSIAGQTDEQGNSTDRLYFPAGIYFHQQNNSLYVADTMNNRIQKWNSSSQEGITVGGSKDGISGYDASTLASPLYVWVDEESDIVYIVDSDNDRIQRWLPNESTATTIAGGEGPGNANNQLSQPSSLAFDNLGNLYVCDSKNHRIQKYLLTDNEKCSVIHSHSLLLKPTINTFIFLSWIIFIDSRSI